MFYLSIHYLESYIGFAGVFNPDGTLSLLARFIYTSPQTIEGTNGITQNDSVKQSYRFIQGQNFRLFFRCYFFMIFNVNNRIRLVLNDYADC